MRWSKVRKLVEESFAPSVRGRVTVHVTNADPRGFGWQDCVQGWINVDDRTVAHMNPHDLRRLILRLPGSRERLIVEPRPEQQVPDGAEVGAFLDFMPACWQYLHSSLNDSLSNDDPFVSSLAVLNAKVGKQRLQRAATRELHALTRYFVDFRLKADAEARARDRSTAPLLT